MAPEPSTLRATCACGFRLWDKRKGAWTLVARVLRVDDAGRFEAKCPECRADVPIEFLQLREAPAPAPRRGAPGATGVSLIIRVDSIPRP